MTRSYDTDRGAILITGGSAGIGLGTAEQLVAGGRDVAVCGRDPQRLDAAVRRIGSCGEGRVLGVVADCVRPEDLTHFYQQAVATFGVVTGLVNNVGTSRKGAFLELQDADWQEDLDLKLFSAIRLSRMVIGALVAEGRPGRIVNVLSVGGKQPGARSAPTTVSRAAGLALTKILAKEFAEHDVLVNAICIGAIKAKQHEDRWRAQERHGDLDDFYAAMAVERKIPVGRVGEVREVAALISFLMGDGASYITGTAINVDGGTASVL